MLNSISPSIHPPVSRYLADTQLATKRVDRQLRELDSQDIPNKEYLKVNMKNIKSELRKSAENLKDFQTNVQDYISEA